MVEREKHPAYVKQGAAAAACMALAAVAMTGVSYRGAEQRADAEWAARAADFHKALAAAEAATGKPEAKLTLAAVNEKEGWSAVGAALMATDVTDRHAMIVRTAMEDRAALAGLDPFQPATLSASAAASAERECLAKAIYYEARSETLAGQVAVADVIVNRTRSQHYPDTICGVVFEGSHRSTGCQFTFTCDGSMRHKPRGLAWTQANMIAAQVMMGLARSTTHGSTHYHTTEVAPVWSASLIETTRIGAHIFYRFPTRKERAAMNAAQRQAAEEALVETGGAVEEEIAAAPPVEAVASEGA